MKLSLFAVIMTVLYVGGVSAADTCPWQRIDIVIFVDQKNTTGQPVHDQTIKPFLTSFIGQLKQQTSNNHDVRVAIVTFGGQLVVQVRLTDDQGKHVLLGKVRSMKYAPGSTNIVKAFEKCGQSKCFDGDNTKQYQSDKTIVMVLTDGSADEASGSQQAVKIFKEKGASVFSVGIGIEESETVILKALASKPHEQHVFNIRDRCKYDALVKMVLKNMKQDQCRKITPTTTEAPTTTAVTTKEVPTTTTVQATEPEQERVVEQFPRLMIAADICFIIDASFSLLPEQFKQEKQFAIHLMKHMPMGEYGARFAVLTFAYNVHIYNYFNNAETSHDLYKKVEDIPFKAEGATFTHAAIQWARTKVFSGSEFTPRNKGVKAAKIAIVITDGAPSIMTKLKEESDLARQDGITILGVGIGPGFSANRRLLMPMVGDKPENLFIANQFDQLESKIAELVDRLRKEA